MIRASASQTSSINSLAPAASRGLANVRIHRRNVLTTTFDREWKSEQQWPLDGFDVVLANPPFTGKIDKHRIVDDVKVGTTTATEILFIKHMTDSMRRARPEKPGPVRRDRA